MPIAQRKPPKDGKPTRFALTAATWGEPVPKGGRGSTRIAAKGRRLVAEYERERTAG